MKAALLALAVLASCAPQGAAAQIPIPEVVGLHVASRHWGESFAMPQGGMNNHNPGFYARWSNGLTAGSYLNSFRVHSAYVGWTFTDSDDRFAVTLGAITGYAIEDSYSPGAQHSVTLCEKVRPNGQPYPMGPFCTEHRVSHRLLPLVVPSVRLPLTNRFAVRLSAMPGVVRALHLSLEMKL